MSATVTNEDKGVTTTTSDHTAASDGATDTCWNVPMTAQIPHPNSVKTDKAVEHTTGKTLFQGGNVVRVGEAMLPSDPAHGDTGGGGGVRSHTYRAEARVTTGSPNIRAESGPPGRTEDPTTQNHGNTEGKIYQDVPAGLLDDNPEEYLKRCSYDTSKIKCGHHEEVEKPEIDVWRGDTITIEAHRKNAKVPDAEPVCASPPHMKWHVTRTGGVNLVGAALPDMAADFTGDTLVLSGDWTAPMGSLTLEGSQERELSPEARRAYIAQKNSFAQANAAARGSPRVENQDAALAYRQVGERINETDRYHAPRLNMARAMVTNLVNLAQFLVAWRAHQNPVRIAIVGTACSGSVTYEVRCYPNSKYSFSVPLDGIIEAGRWVSRTFTFVRSLGQLADVNVEGNFRIPGDVAIGLEFQWKEPEEEAELYEIAREAELSIQGKLFELGAELAFPLTNLLAIIPGIGVAVARAIGWVLRRIGAEASVGAGFSISLSAAVLTTFKWTEKHGWHWDKAGIKLPIELRFYLFIRLRWGDTVHVEMQAVVSADPALLLEANAEGLRLKSDDFMVRIGFAGVIQVSTWFYTFEQSGTWYPEAWTFRVGSVPLCTLIGN
jgi:hypothetical protein